MNTREKTKKRKTELDGPEPWLVDALTESGADSQRDGASADVPDSGSDDVDGITLDVFSLGDE